MDEGFAWALSDWTPFSAALGGIAATLLGLLFVSVSLRLNLFRDVAVADVRDFAALIFGQYLTLVLLGLGWGVRVAAKHVRLNRTPGSRSG